MGRQIQQNKYFAHGSSKSRRFLYYLLVNQEIVVK